MQCVAHRLWAQKRECKETTGKPWGWLLFLDPTLDTAQKLRPMMKGQQETEGQTADPVASLYSIPFGVMAKGTGGSKFSRPGLNSGSIAYRLWRLSLG